MDYLLLIYEDEAKADPSPEAMSTMMKEYGAYNEELVSRGAYKAGEALQPTGTATTVRVREGKTLTTDGPFAETKEQLGGFYWVEAKDLDEAIEFAAKIPAARIGSIEVRPIWKIEP